MEISAAIHSQEQCIALALQLKIEEDEVFKILDETFSDQMAYKIMKKWMKANKEQATGSLLHSALCRMERQDLADRFEHRLLQKGSAE